MRRTVTAEELARLAGVKATTVRKTAKDLLELLKHDMEAAEWERTAARMERDRPTKGEVARRAPGLRRSQIFIPNLIVGAPPDHAMSRGHVASARVAIDAPASSVWDAFVNPAVIRKYAFGAEVESDWREGSPIRWQGMWKGRAYEDKGEVLEVEEGRRLSYSHFSPITGLSDEQENYHTITVEIGGEDGRTTVTLTQDNNPDDEANEHSQKNWESMLQNLKQLLEADPDRPPP